MKTGLLPWQRLCSILSLLLVTVFGAEVLLLLDLLPERRRVIIAVEEGSYRFPKRTLPRRLRLGTTRQKHQDQEQGEPCHNCPRADWFGACRIAKRSKEDKANPGS
jgi:hypothetical protein